jgi:hypothetical protein
MLPFRGEDRKGQQLFWKGKGSCEVTGRCSDTAVCSGSRKPELDGIWIEPEAEDNQLDQLGQKAVWTEYCCEDQTCCQNIMG